MDSLRIIDYISDSKFGQHVYRKQEKINIASAGTLVPRKQQFEVVRACHGLIKKGYPIILNLYGYSNIFAVYAKQIEDYIAQHHLEKSIIMNGFVEDDHEITDNNDMIVTASIEEGLPQGILFNMAAGMVAVATPVGGIGEIVIDGETGYLAKGFGVNNFEEALQRAIDDRERWPEVIQNAMALLRKEGSQEKLCGDLLQYMAKKVALTHHVLDPLPKATYGGASSFGGVLALRYQMRQISSEAIHVSRTLKSKRRYIITINQPSVSRIGLIFTSFDGPMAGVVTLSLLYKGNPLCLAALPLDSIAFNRWTFFCFEQPLTGYHGRNVELLLKLEYTSPARAVVYEENRNFTLICKIEKKLGFEYTKPNILYVDMQS